MLTDIEGFLHVGKAFPGKRLFKGFEMEFNSTPLWERFFYDRGNRWGPDKNDDFLCTTGR